MVTNCLLLTQLVRFVGIKNDGSLCFILFETSFHRSKIKVLGIELSQHFESTFSYCFDGIDMSEYYE